MTQKDKELLLKDLCARLSYDVMGSEVLNNKIWGLPELLLNVNVEEEKVECSDSLPYSLENFRPYLRSMSNMTQDECTQLSMLLPKSYIVYPEEIHNINELTKIFPEHIEIITDFYNSHYIDWRGLIPKGLALEASKDMYNIE